MKHYLRWDGAFLFEGVCSDGRHIVVDSGEMRGECEIGRVDFHTLANASLTDEASSYESLDPDLWQQVIERGFDSRRGKTIFYQEHGGNRDGSMA